MEESREGPLIAQWKAGGTDAGTRWCTEPGRIKLDEILGPGFGQLRYLHLAIGDVVG